MERDSKKRQQNSEKRNVESLLPGADGSRGLQGHTGRGRPGRQDSGRRTPCLSPVRDRRGTTSPPRRAGRRRPPKRDPSGSPGLLGVAAGSHQPRPWGGPESHRFPDGKDFLQWNLLQPAKGPRTRGNASGAPPTPPRFRPCAPATGARRRRGGSPRRRPGARGLGLEAERGASERGPPRRHEPQRRLRRTPWS